MSASQTSDKLFEECQSVNSTDPSRKLHKSALSGHVDCLKVLIQAGADMNEQDEDGFTALMFAAEKGHVECVNVLMEAGADVSKVNMHGDTALFDAAENGHVECVKALIEAGVDVNKQSALGQTALFRAARNGHITCLKVLIEAGADVNKQNIDCHTALIYAVALGYLNCVKALIEAGADVNVADNDGNTVLAQAGDVNCTRFLLREGAKINMFNNENLNALQVDISDGHDRGRVPDKDVDMLLFVAGERVDGTTVEATYEDGKVTQVPVPDYLLHKDLKLNLKHLCRETIRKHLINIDPHQHLFGRIPQLGLPGSITAYLLYYMSLDDDTGDNGDDDVERTIKQVTGIKL